MIAIKTYKNHVIESLICDHKYDHTEAMSLMKKEAEFINLSHRKNTSTTEVADLIHEFKQNRDSNPMSNTTAVVLGLGALVGIGALVYAAMKKPDAAATGQLNAPPMRRDTQFAQRSYPAYPTSGSGFPGYGGGFP